MAEMTCNSKNLTFYHCACARELHGKVMFVIRMLNSVYISLFLDMFPPPPSKPKMFFGQWNVATYIHIICKSHLGSRGGGGEQGCWHQRRQHTTENFNIRCKYSVSKYTEASTVQIYKIVSYRRGWTTIYLALSVFCVFQYSTENSTYSW